MNGDTNGQRDEAGRQRVVIEGVTPEVDGGRFPIKRIVGEKVVVETDAYTDGHDAVTCRLLYRPDGAAEWSEAAMLPLPPLPSPQNDDRWRGELTVDREGRWRYTVSAWVDPFKTWRRDLEKRVAAGQDAGPELRLGAALIREAGRRAEAEGKKPAARILAGLAQDLEAGADPAARLRLALDDELAQLMDRHADRSSATTWRELGIVVDRERARFSSWYEMSPRSAGTSLQDAAALLPSVARMGFDVFSLQLGLPAGEMSEDFRRFREKAAGLGVEIALRLDPDRSVFDRGIAEGVRIFSVDSPDTAPFPLWEQTIGEVKREHPDVLFLAEAVARPKAAQRLAKLGFTQSRRELSEPFTALHGMQDFLRPNLVPSPADSRTVFVQRFLLAATLGASYSFYAPLFAAGSEQPDSLGELIALVNKIRRENPALHTDRGLRFHSTDNDQILCFSKVDDKRDNTILVTVNLDPEHVQSGWVELPVDALGLPRDQPYQVHDLLTGARYLWHGTSNFVQLDPQSIPAHIFRVRRRVRSGRGLDAFV
jgi:hypothetical protein